MDIYHFYFDMCEKYLEEKRYRCKSPWETNLILILADLRGDFRNQFGTSESTHI
jgi:hypothetical protein